MFADLLRRKPGFVVLAAAATLAAVIWWPTYQDISRLRGEIDAAGAELDTARNRGDSLTQLAADVRLLEQRVGGLDKQVLPFVQSPTVLRALSLLVEAEGLGNQSISTLNARRRPDYITMPVDLNFEGDGLSTMRFLKRVEAMPQLLQIESMAMTVRDRGDAPAVQTAMRLNAFFYQDQPEAQP